MYGDTALAPDGAEHFGGFDGTSLTGLQLHPYSGVLIQGQRHTLFSVLVSADAGYIRLWVDGHLMVDGPGSPAAVSTCSTTALCNCVR